MKRVICIRLFDLHCDTLGNGLHRGFAITGNTGAVDLRRGRAYAPWVQAFAAFIPDNLRGEEARRECSALLDVAKRWEWEHPENFKIVRARADLTGDFTGCRALLTGEGIGALDSPDSLDDLRASHLRVAALTWNGDNAWASGCFGSGDGLTALGRRALDRMQMLGITVDVSHLNERGFWDVARLSNRPIIASHSNAVAVCPHPRNLTDDQFRAIRDGGGIVGLNLYSAHLGIPYDGDHADAFRRHLEHFLSLDGEDTVCIGTDLDGMDIPSSWNGMAYIRILYTKLLSCGYSAALLDKVFYTNAFCFFSEALA